MRIRNRKGGPSKQSSGKSSRSEILNYQSLEPRQVLTTFAGASAFVQHLPLNESAVVVRNLDAAPDITQQPEHGELQFNADDGTLVYEPDSGFTGQDAFQLASSANEFTLRVWETAYAVADWVLLQPGDSTSINVLDNDYAFLESAGSGFAIHGFSSVYQWQRDATGFTIVDFKNETSATVSISADGKSIEYEAADGFVGTDVMTYVLEDENGFRSTATMTIEVSAETENPDRYFSESQWLHQHIDSWLETHSRSLLRQSAFDIVVGGLNFDLGTVRSLDDGDIDQPEVNIASVAVGGEVQFDQVANVQEGDIVKSQGDLLYYVTQVSDGGHYESYLSIVDFTNPDAPQILSTTGFDQRVRDIFLDDGRVAVILDQTYAFDPSIRDLILQGQSFANESNFDLVVLDVSDSASPSEVYRATIDGSYTDARLIEDELYIVSGTPDSEGPSPWVVFGNDSDVVPVSPGDFIDAILAMDDGGFKLPSITVESAGNSETITVDIATVVRRDDNFSATLVSTFGLQSETGTPLDIDLVESGVVGTVYVSTNAIYLFDGRSAMKFAFQNDASLENDAGVEFVADGRLEGNIHGQLAVDEYEGFLRLVVTDWTNEISVHVLQQVDDSLEIVSSLNNIAPGESLFATHFSGDQAFIVTFLQVDPLFVIDLSDPVAPTIAGELTLPGFSNHLQLIGDGLLLSVGRDADPNTGIFDSLQVSLFDISNSSTPTLLDQYVFDGGRSTSTPLVDWIRGAPNHDALTFDPLTGTLALPIYSVAWEPDGIFEGNASAISLLQIDRTNGIVESGSIEFDSRALRTTIVGDHLVYLSQDGLQTATRDSPTVILSEIALPISGADEQELDVEEVPVDEPLEIILVEEEEVAEAEEATQEIVLTFDDWVSLFVGPRRFEQFALVDIQPVTDIELEDVFEEVESVQDFSILDTSEFEAEKEKQACSRPGVAPTDLQRELQPSTVRENAFGEKVESTEADSSFSRFKKVESSTLDFTFAGFDNELTSDLVT